MLTRSLVRSLARPHPQMVMSRIPAEEQCTCSPEKHNAANPLTSFVQGIFGSSSSSGGSTTGAGGGGGGGNAKGDPTVEIKRDEL